MTIEILLFLGFIAGFIVGALLGEDRLGCLLLAIVPVAMFAYVGWWQSEHPESLRSTSGLDFLFGPLWPSAGAVAGLWAARWLRSLPPRP